MLLEKEGDKALIENIAEQLASRIACDSVHSNNTNFLTIDLINDIHFRRYWANLLQSYIKIPEARYKSLFHSKVLCVLNVQDGSYLGTYVLDRKQKTYGSELTFSVGRPGLWLALTDDLRTTIWEYASKSWDPRTRPWATQGPSRWIHYNDPATGDLIESFVCPVPSSTICGIVIAASIPAH
mmetsp:Transcript_18009/g.21833  ORF Transcript_18009/g.21833 Transcript_18009/m.21833 type:complete len:182 (+) Transcript_18009:3-548(+)